MEEFDTKLQVKLDDRDVTIDVKDIIKSDVTNKEYIIYKISGLEEIYTSLIVENNQGLILEEVTDEGDFNIVSARVEEILNGEQHE